MRCSERRRVPRREANVRSTEIEVVKVSDRSWAGSRLSVPDGRNFRVTTAVDPERSDDSPHSCHSGVMERTLTALPVDPDRLSLSRQPARPNLAALG